MKIHKPFQRTVLEEPVLAHDIRLFPYLIRLPSTILPFSISASPTRARCNVQWSFTQAVRSSEEQQLSLQDLFSQAKPLRSVPFHISMNVPSAMEYLFVAPLIEACGLLFFRRFSIKLSRLIEQLLTLQPLACRA